MPNAIDEQARLLVEEELVDSSVPSTSERLGLRKVAVASVFGLLVCAIGVYNYPQTDSVGLSKTSDFGAYTTYSSKNTGSNHGKTGQLIYLDRHNINCGNDAIRYFKMTRPSSNNIRYSYRCQQTESAGARVINSYTASTSKFYGPKVHYIDRQPWTGCNSGYALTQFKAVNKGSNNIRYDYTCKQYDGYMDNCSDKTTGKSNIANQYIYYLDRFALDCGNKVMTGFQARGAGGTVYYKYSCCTQNYYDPTPAPISRPTEAPVAKPTFEPTLAPTHEPTKVGYIMCPAKVTADYKGKLLNLKEGCASFANDDIGYANFDGVAYALTVCTDTEVEVHEKELREYGLIGTKKEHDGISFVQNGKNIRVTYTTKNGKVGHFENENAFVHSDDNDAIVSVKVTSHGAQNVPSQCEDV
jgi:hypothetical protein